MINPMGSIADKWLHKSLNSFNTGKNYQGIKQVNVALVRLIEENQFEKVADYFSQILPILDKKKLYHEIEQIIYKYLSYLKRKHLVLKTWIKPLFWILINSINENSHPQGSFHALKCLLSFAETASEEELINFLSENYSNLLDKTIKSVYHEKLVFQFFRLFIVVNRFDIALKIADPAFLENINSTDQLTHGMYAVLVVANQKGLEAAKEKIFYFRKTIPKHLQSSEIFKCSSEFILVALSKDLEWLSELKTHFSSFIKSDDLLRVLIKHLLRKYFPETRKSSIFDLFKMK
jgi:hypothetical protein